MAFVKGQSGNTKEICGIIMPISALDGCTDIHWSEVQKIIGDSIEDAGFSGNLVSNSDDATLIHKTIIQNLYDNPVAVCDVSGKNPNVMFELGVRLAFDKPTIIVKDDKTSYSFDTSGIEHIEYPRDLRFSKIVDFKKKLSEKIKATHKKSKSDSEYTSFLKHFGEFKVAKLNQKEVSGQELIVDELKSLRMSMRRLERGASDRFIRHDPYFSDKEFDSGERLDMCMGEKSSTDIKEMINLISVHPDIKNMRIRELSPGHSHLLLSVRDGADVAEIEKLFGGKCRIVKPKIKRAEG